jgi:hypothetical protein
MVVVLLHRNHVDQRSALSYKHQARVRRGTVCEWIARVLIG